ncbi:thioredoxin family protein [Salinibacterium sp. SWN139]|uniref:thioredoxin domain-containing protein n=1 Tax=Salinibacterium sp. SWN139 TaxID=2792055 RepID=UPI0018CF4D81|nr:thioredoxin family protein [Salinibacterium sp. SWN139]MBH0054409.1 thioredoxin family protein [Salinibacterium sp. SWN139]
METLFVLVGLVAFATVLGLFWRDRTGRIKRTATTGSSAATAAGSAAASEKNRIVIDGVAPFGSRVTLLQFSTAACAICPTVHTQLSALAGELDDGTGSVVHVEVDVTSRPELASRFNLLQSPTTFILGGNGVLQARIGGAPKIADVRAELHRMLALALG